jgi:hypothetical protein
MADVNLCLILARTTTEKQENATHVIQDTGYQMASA